MSRPGTPYDNAIMEKFWNDFKVEWWDKQHRALMSRLRTSF
ncbi:integrase core domain-containing protein [Weissella confusa]|nr:integrase core domain-containing protein [Weissella confusa]